MIKGIALEIIIGLIISMILFSCKTVTYSYDAKVVKSKKGTVTKFR